MTYHALVIELLTATGGAIGDIYRVDAESAQEAVAKIANAKSVPEYRVSLISDEEVDVWRELGIPIREIQEGV